MQAMNHNMRHFVRNGFCKHFTRMRNKQLRIQPNMAAVAPSGENCLPRRAAPQVKPNFGDR